MSVLIKGMEMPKSCSKCGWFDMGGGDGYRCTLLRKSFDMWNKISVARDKSCPLIEVPPHGDLVDRTELLAEYDRQHKGPAGGARRIMEQATAIIKAEESET